MLSRGEIEQAKKEQTEQEQNQLHKLEEEFNRASNLIDTNETVNFYDENGTSVLCWVAGIILPTPAMIKLENERRRNLDKWKWLKSGENPLPEELESFRAKHVELDKQLTYEFECREYVDNLEKIELLVRKLIDRGMDLDAVDSLGNTLLHYAAQSNNLKVVELLLEKGATPFVRNIHGLAPIDFAMFNREEYLHIKCSKETDIIQKLGELLYGKSLTWPTDPKNKNTDTPLYTLFKNAWYRLPIEPPTLEQVKQATAQSLKKGHAPIDTHPHLFFGKSAASDYWLPLHYAASLGCSKEVLEELSKEHKDLTLNPLEVRDYNTGSTPLMLALSNDKLETFKALLEIGSNVNAVNYKGHSVLVLALIYGKRGFCEALLDWQINHPDQSLELQDDWGVNIFHIIALNGMVGYISLFKEKLTLEILLAKADVNKPVYEDNRTPLQMAAIKRFSDVVEDLLTIDCIDVNCTDKNGDTALDLAINVIKACQQQEVSSSSYPNQNDYKTILNLFKKGAVAKPENIELLYNFIKKINENEIKSKGWRSPSIKIYLELFAMLVPLLSTIKREEKLELFVSGVIGESSLLTAVLISLDNERRFIFEKVPVEFKVIFNDEITQYFLESLNKKLDILEENPNKHELDKLIKKSKIGSSGDSLLHWLALEGHKEQLDRFIKLDRTYINEKNNCEFALHQGESLLHAAIRGKHVNLVVYLLEQEEIKLYEESDRGNTPLGYAIESGNEYIAILVLAHVESVLFNDLENKSKFGEVLCKQINQRFVNSVVPNRNCYTSNLLMAIEQGNLTLVRRLVQLGADLTFQDSSSKFPLLTAAQLTEPEVLKFLFKTRGVNLYQRSTLYYNVFCYVADCKDPQKMSSLLELLQEIKGPCIQAKELSFEENSPLHFAVRRPKNRAGFPRLDHYSCKYSDVIKLIVKDVKKHSNGNQEIARGYFNLKNAEGKTPLHVAIEEGNFVAFRELINTGFVDLETKDNKGNNLLHTALRFPRQGAWGRQCPDKDDQTCLELLLTALNGKIDKRYFNLKNAEGKTPLHVAIEQGNSFAVNELIKTGVVDLETKDNYGNNLLHAALRFPRLDNRCPDKDDQTCLKLLLTALNKKDENLPNKLYRATNINHQLPIHLFKTEQMEETNATVAFLKQIKDADCIDQSLINWSAHENEEYSEHIRGAVYYIMEDSKAIIQAEARAEAEAKASAEAKARYEAEVKARAEKECSEKQAQKQNLPATFKFPGLNISPAPNSSPSPAVLQPSAVALPIHGVFAPARNQSPPPVVNIDCSVEISSTKEEKIEHRKVIIKFNDPTLMLRIRDLLSKHSIPTWTQTDNLVIGLSVGSGTCGSYAANKGKANFRPVHPAIAFPDIASAQTFMRIFSLPESSNHKTGAWNKVDNKSTNVVYFSADLYNKPIEAKVDISEVPLPPAEHVGIIAGRQGQ